MKHATIAETWTRIRNNRLKAPNGQLRHRFHQPDLDICWRASTGPSLHIKPWSISVFDFLSLFLNCCKLFPNFQKSLSDNHCHSILTSNGWLSKASSLSDSTFASFFWKVDHNLHLASESYFLAPWVIIFQTCCTWSDSSKTTFLGTEQRSVGSRPPQF